MLALHYGIFTIKWCPSIGKYFISFTQTFVVMLLILMGDDDRPRDHHISMFACDPFTSDEGN